MPNLPNDLRVTAEMRRVFGNNQLYDIIIHTEKTSDIIDIYLNHLETGQKKPPPKNRVASEEENNPTAKLTRQYLIEVLEKVSIAENCRLLQVFNMERETDRKKLLGSLKSITKSLEKCRKKEAEIPNERRMDYDEYVRKLYQLKEEIKNIMTVVKAKADEWGEKLYNTSCEDEKYEQIRKTDTFFCQQLLDAEEIDEAISKILQCWLEVKEPIEIKKIREPCIDYLKLFQMVDIDEVWPLNSTDPFSLKLKEAAKNYIADVIKFAENAVTLSERIITDIQSIQETCANTKWDTIHSDLIYEILTQKYSDVAIAGAEIYSLTGKILKMKQDIQKENEKNIPENLIERYKRIREILDCQVDMEQLQTNFNIFDVYDIN